MTTLQTIATIRSGYTFRSRIEEDQEGDISLIQVRDLDYDALSFEKPQLRINLEVPDNESLVQSGDILFTAKGVQNAAILVEHVQGPTIIPSALFNIRVTSPDVAPPYVAWYLNQVPAQQYLNSRQRGSSIPIINKKTLSELPIPVPEPAVQTRIVAADRLLRQEMNLLDQIRLRRSDLVTTLLLQSVEVG